MTATGVWSYTLDNTDPAVQALNGRDTLTDTLTVQTVDGTAQVITVTIHGPERRPDVTGDTTGDVVEAGGVNNGTPATPTATGDLDSDDVDNPDDTWQAVAAGTANGASAPIPDCGRRLDLYPRQQRPGRAGAQRARHADRHVRWCTTVDGTRKSSRSPSHAQNDTPIVTGDITGNVVEAGGVNNGTPGTPTATGNVNSDDVDNPDDTWHARPWRHRRLRHLRADRTGVWTYTLDNTDPAVQALNVGRR